ncbi:MAG: GlmU family protein [Bacteroidales bacterium]|nr:GlmU family protein [Bacteroidales bacterium]
MNYILFDDKQTITALLPMTFTRPACDLRYGILTIREKWEYYLSEKTSTLTLTYLSKKYPIKKGDVNILIKSNLIPDNDIVSAVKSLAENQVLVSNEVILAYKVSGENFDNPENEIDENIVEYSGEVSFLENTWQLFSDLDKTIRHDFEILTKGRKSQPIPQTANVLGNDIFVEEGAKIDFTTINTTTGPVYIGKDAEIMEGCLVRGPFALGEHAQLKMGAKIYGPTSFGPYCKVGGEVSNSIFLGYSNKAHDGFIGNSVIGEWCNLGAGTNCSNLKNTYDPVRLWNYQDETFANTGLQFCGVIMGDHSKVGINSMINTGTVIGVSVNLFGTGFPRNMITSFSWGGANGFKVYNLNKAFQVAERVYARRGKDFDETEKDILRHIYHNVVR